VRGRRSPSAVLGGGIMTWLQTNWTVRIKMGPCHLLIGATGRLVPTLLGIVAARQGLGPCPYSAYNVVSSFRVGHALTRNADRRKLSNLKKTRQKRWNSRQSSCNSRQPSIMANRCRQDWFRGQFAKIQQRKAELSNWVACTAPTAWGVFVGN
jgi:hypothetical protein